MIIINLKGGLGNQMFQYALGYVLAKKNNPQIKLYGQIANDLKLGDKKMKDDKIITVNG